VALHSEIKSDTPLDQSDLRDSGKEDAKNKTVNGKETDSGKDSKKKNETEKEKSKRNIFFFIFFINRNDIKSNINNFTCHIFVSFRHLRGT